MIVSRSLNQGLARIRTESGIRVEWRTETGQVISIQAPKPELRNLQQDSLSDEELQVKAAQSLGHLVPPSLALEIRPGIIRDEIRHTTIFGFDLRKNGVGFGLRPAGYIEFDNKLAQILSFNCSIFPHHVPEESGTTLSPAQLRAAVDRFYLETAPLAQATSSEFGLRWIRNKEHAPYKHPEQVNRFSPAYEDKLTLAWTAAFDWQIVAVDARNGKLILVDGWNPAFGRSEGSQPPNLAGVKFAVPGAVEQTFQLEPSSSKLSSVGKLVILRGQNNLVVTGRLDSAQSLIEIGGQVFSIPRGIAKALT